MNPTNETKGPADANGAGPGRSHMHPDIVPNSSTIARSDRDVVTIIRDPRRSLGKSFTLDTNGKPVKQAEVWISRAEAVMRHVSTPEDFADVLCEVTADPHTALILDRVKGIEVGEPFIVMSVAALAKRLGVTETDREKLLGVHRFADEDHPVVARLKENFLPGTWCLADRDNDEHTPPEFRDADYEQWVELVDRVVPGFAHVDRVHVESSSARVTHDGVPVGGGNGHTFFKVANPDDLERARIAAELRAVEHGVFWLKPKRSKATGEVCANVRATVLDLSTWNPGRLVFDGAPTVDGEGLVVRDAEVNVYARAQRSVDSSLIDTPDAARVRELGKRLGAELRLSRSGASLKVDAYDLRLDTMLETERFGDLTVADILQAPSPMRVQAPMRVSKSWAGKLNFNYEGRPFVHDVGTGTNHWLAHEDWDSIKPDMALEFEAAAEAEHAIAKAAQPVPVALDWSTLPSDPAEPKFVIPDWMPDGVVTLFAAHGGTGKSFLSLYIALCLATGRHPFEKGATIERRKVLLYSAEDNMQVMRSRLARYMRLLGIAAADLKGWLHILDATECDNVLFQGAEHKVEGRTTARFEWLAREVQAFGAQVLVFDNASDALDANENDRAKVRQFMSSLKRLAAAVLLLAHVDALSSMADVGAAKGYSGSTGWHNSARSRWFMARVKDSDDVVLTLPKVNYAKAGSEAVIRWSDAHRVFEVLTVRQGRPKAEDSRVLLLELLQQAITQGRTISPSTNTTTSVFNTLKGMPGFPAELTTAGVAAEVSKWLGAGLVKVEQYPRSNRTTGERLVLTDVARQLLAAGGADADDVAGAAHGAQGRP